MFAGHAERYSKVKHDQNLNDSIMQEAMSFGQPDLIAYYERPWNKKLRQLYTGVYYQEQQCNWIQHRGNTTKNCA